MNTVELNSINLQSIDVASNNVSSIGKFIKRNKGIKLLPKEYQQVEYIEGTGTQWIDTNAILKQNSSFDVRFYEVNIPNPATAQNRTHIVGFHDGSNRFRIRRIEQDTFYFLYGKDGASWRPGGDIIMKNRLIDFHYSINEFTASRDGTTYTHTPSQFTFIQSNSTIKLFAEPSVFGEQMFEGRFYFFKLKEDNTLVRNLIPCYRKSDGEVGMYDVVNDVFYTNQGTGAFLKGPNVNDKDHKTPYIKGHITTSDSTFTFSVDGNSKTVPVDANGDFKLKVKKPITSLSFVGVPQLESLELFAINGVTTFDVDYPTAVSYIKCDSTTKNAKNDVYHIRGTATDDFDFTLKYVDDNNTVTTVTESAVIDGDGNWDVAYSGKKIYSLESSFYNKTILTKIELTDKMDKLTTLCQSGNSGKGCFQNCTNLTEVYFNDNTVFVLLTNAQNTFYGCSALSKTNFDSCDFPELINAYQMFQSCPSILKLDFTSDFPKLENMRAIIISNSIKTISFKNAKLDKVKTMFQMLYGCSSLETLDISIAEPIGLDSSVNDIKQAFNSNGKLAELIVPNNSSLGFSVDLRNSPLSYDSMLRVAGWLKDLTGGTAQTVTFKAATYDALTAEQKAELEGIIVTQKGWVLATA